MIYDNIAGFSAGLSNVRLAGKYGFINMDGKLVIPIIYTYASSFSNTKCKVELDGQNFYIDKTGKCIENCPSGKSSSTEKNSGENSNVKTENPTGQRIQVKVIGL